MSAAFHADLHHGDDSYDDEDEDDGLYEDQEHDDEDDDEDEEDEEEEEEEEEEDDEEEEDEDGHAYAPFAPDGQGIEVEVEIQGHGNAGPVRRTLRLGGGFNQRQLLELLRGRDLSDLLFGDDDDFDEESRRSFIQRRADPKDFPKVPSEEGRKLMDSGGFGSFDIRDRKQKDLSRRILDRELALGGTNGQKRNRGLMLQQQIPSTTPEMIIHYEEPVCCGQFSDDGNFFYNAAKDFKVRLYDTSNPYEWKHYKTVHHPFAAWTLTDAALSPDNKWLAFTSLQTDVCLTPTDPADTGEPYTLSFSNGYRFAIFSIRFSGDGRQLIAGTGADSIIVYDIERRSIVHHVTAHMDDVNAVCFADKMSPHILYSGSDDCTIKVWDTRSLGDGRPAGAFVGHTQGITYIDSKGDGRYILSNGKEQSMKLWDLRMAHSGTWFEENRPTDLTQARQNFYNYDYRWQDFDDNYFYKHPNDNSLVTFRGHKVQRTLIRCHFSPPGSTDSRYVYSGSHDGNIYIWNMDATIAKKIDVQAATAGRVRPRPHRRYMLHHDYDSAQTTLVRDVGWHPSAPILVASAWNGGSMDAGTATIHSYNELEADEGDPKMGRSVNEKLEPMESNMLYV